MKRKEENRAPSGRCNQLFVPHARRKMLFCQTPDASAALLLYDFKKAAVYFVHAHAYGGYFARGNSHSLKKEKNARRH